LAYGRIIRRGCDALKISTSIFIYRNDGSVRKNRLGQEYPTLASQPERSVFPCINGSANFSQYERPKNEILNNLDFWLALRVRFDLLSVRFSSSQFDGWFPAEQAHPAGEEHCQPLSVQFQLPALAIFAVISRQIAPKVP
jgi:hypothetical protein